jgi:hypothetical protein
MYTTCRGCPTPITPCTLAWFGSPCMCTVTGVMATATEQVAVAAPEEAEEQHTGRRRR